MVRRGEDSVRSELTIEILVFTLGGVCCGIDCEQIGRMVRLDEAERGGGAVYWLHKLLSFGDREVSYRNPLVIGLQGITGEKGLVIEHPRDLVKVSLESICPLPGFFEMRRELRVFWGGIVMDGKIVLLIDPGRFAAVNPGLPGIGDSRGS